MNTQTLVDVLAPGFRALQGAGLKAVELTPHLDRITVRMDDGTEHDVVTAEDLFGIAWPRLKALAVGPR